MKTTQTLLQVAFAILATTFLIPAPPAVAQAGDSPALAVTATPYVASSPAIADVIKLVQAGVGDEVLITFINHSRVPYNPTANDLIYLKDIGISDLALKALLPAITPAPAPAPAPVQVASVAPPAPPAAASVVEITPQQQVTVSYFYEPLSPYGKWVLVPDLGYCWQPTVATVDPGWRPYAQRGHWVDTDRGWYWESDYSWGWAAFHYGRWAQHGRLGWVWMPDTVWAPAWVSWRHNNDYCGWAPLPPAAHYRPGFGLSFFDGRVGVSLEFGLRHDQYTFVQNSRFYDRHPYQHAAAPAQVVNIYQNTTVVNNYTTVNNTTIIHHGASYAAVSKAATAPVPKVTIKDLPATPGNPPHQPANSVRGTTLYRAPLTPPQPEKVQAIAKHLASTAGPVTPTPVHSAGLPTTSLKPVVHDTPYTTPRPTVTLPGTPAPHVTKPEVPEAPIKRPVTDSRPPQPVRSPEPVKPVLEKHPTPTPPAPRSVEVPAHSNSLPTVVPVPRPEVQPPTRRETSPALPPTRPPQPTVAPSGKPSKTDPKSQDNPDRPGHGPKSDPSDKR